MQEFNLTEEQLYKIDTAINMKRAMEGYPPLTLIELTKERQRFLLEISYLSDIKPTSEDLSFPEKSKYIKLLKPGGYKDKNEKVKPPIFIKGIPYALRTDIEAECSV